jgi:hypothetical protein
LADHIAGCTGLLTAILLEKQHRQNFHPFSVAARLSWAADRETTREEDRAYSLMGLFDVNMPIIYGVGQSAAFFRLQMKILKATTDHSIFAWMIPVKNPVKKSLAQFYSFGIHRST